MSSGTRRGLSDVQTAVLDGRLVLVAEAGVCLRHRDLWSVKEAVVMDRERYLGRTRLAVYFCRCDELGYDDLDPKITQLTRVRAAKREVAKHGMAWPSSAVGLDLDADDS